MNSRKETALSKGQSANRQAMQNSIPINGEFGKNQKESGIKLLKAIFCKRM
jgi:hypothetical protein